MALSQYEHSNGRLPPAVVTHIKGNAMGRLTLVIQSILGNASYLACSFGEAPNAPNDSFRPSRRRGFGVNRPIRQSKAAP